MRCSTPAPRILPGTACSVYGQPGVIAYTTRGHSVGGVQRVGNDAWVGVLLAGERGISEFQPFQVEVCQ